MVGYYELCPILFCIERYRLRILQGSLYLYVNIFDAVFYSCKHLFTCIPYRGLRNPACKYEIVVRCYQFYSLLYRQTAKVCPNLGHRALL